MKAILIISILLIASSCVTVKLGSTEGHKAVGVSIREPSPPFERVNRQDVDAAFKNPVNGNVISYVSDCKDPADPSLDGIVSTLLTDLTDLKIEFSQNTTFRDRDARRVQAHGKVDGVESALDLLVFKRNDCIFILTYLGVKSAFAENRSEFDKFVEGFEVP